MGKSYIPTKLSSFVTFAANFDALILANPGLYGLAPGDAAAIDAAYQSFIGSNTVSANTGTRTAPAVAATQNARNSLTAVIRAYGRVVNSNLGVSDANKVALGLALHDAKPSPIPAPSSAPVLAVTAATPGVLTCTFRDTNATPGSRAKPAGVTQLEVYAATSTTVITDPTVLPFKGLQTKTPFALNFDGADKGKTAYIACRWNNAKGQPGPWSAITTAIVV